MTTMRDNCISITVNSMHFQLIIVRPEHLSKICAKRSINHPARAPTSQHSRHKKARPRPGSCTTYPG